MNVSSYIYGTSFYHRFDVRPKLVSTLLFCAAAFLMESYTGFMVVLVLPLAVMAASVGARETWRCWSRLLPLFLILLAFIPLQARDGDVLVSINGFAVATREGVWMVTRIVSRLGGISCALMLLLLTERNENIIRGLRAFHIPYAAALTASMILRFIPYLRMIPETAASLEERGFGRKGRSTDDRLPRPRGYFLQWLIGAIIPISLLIVR